MKKKYFVRGKVNPVNEKEIEFMGLKGNNINIKKGNVSKLHKMINLQPKYTHCKVLEVSSKSDVELGKKCSAFNLMMDGYSFEAIFQSSKVFEGNVQFKEVLDMKPSAAKVYIRNNKRGRNIIGFNYNGEEFPNIPYTYFYDYMYCKCVDENLSEEEKKELLKYSIFTDIEFGSGALNCQAKSLCIYSYLYKNNKLDLLNDKEKFKEEVYKERVVR